jgi:hypothetical protein
MKIILLPLVIIMFLAALLTGALALIDHNSYIVGGEYVIREGETVQGNLSLFFAQVTLDKDSRLDGSILSFSSVVDVRGAVTGDISSVESEVNVQQSAQVKVVPRDTDLFPLVVLLPEMARWNVPLAVR